ARDHTRARRRRLHEYTSSPMFANDLVRDRPTGERNVHQPATRRVHSLTHRFRHFVGFARRDTDATLTVADRNECVEAEASAAFHDFGYAIDGNHVLDEIAAFVIAFGAAAARTIAAATTTSAVTTFATAAAARSSTGATARCTAATTWSAATAAATTASATSTATTAATRGRCTFGRSAWCAIALIVCHAQNSRPPSRAPSATAFTRPWYLYPARSNTTREIPAAFAR